MPQFGWHINIAKCIGCRGCEAACKQEFNLEAGVQRRRVILQEGFTGSGGSEQPFMRYITMSCNHCANPACVPACPTAALTKSATTGLVSLDESKCNGCKRCMAGCPYGAIQYNEETKKVDKCTGCGHRLDNLSLPAEKRAPACVITCSSYALRFSKDLTTIDGGAFGEATKTTAPPTGYSDISDPTYTNPSVRFSNKRTD
ncbi:MAG: 4Fe-4S dicluster domain-containing protein [Deltaproteobacteria bacterium]|nr:4Fe-4S dicluster domain-containing protein [Deltaproteobacteria bacterium]